MRYLLFTIIFLACTTSLAQTLEIEPNDDPYDADLLETTIRGQISDQLDEDWYGFEIKEYSKVTLRFDPDINAPSGISAEGWKLEIYNLDEVLVTSGQTRGDLEIVSGLDEDIYLVRVMPRTEFGYSSSFYNLSLIIEEASDNEKYEVEPNDQFFEATKFETQIKGIISDQSDEDWLRIDLEKSYQVNIDFIPSRNAPSGLSFEGWNISLFNGSINKIFEGETRGPYGIQGILLSDSYYIVLKPRTEFAYSDYQYTVNVTYSKIDDPQRDALLELYNSTNGGDWLENQGWDDTIDECLWYGITCENDKVLEINLASNNLRGKIPAEIGNLPELQKLDLHENKLTGSIPVEIGNLTQLIYLNLDFNDLSKIPSTVGKLNNLEFLSLSSNEIEELPDDLGKLKKLRFLNLSSNFLAGSINPELGNLENLNSLFLYSNEFSGHIPIEIGNLKNLEVLSLGFNQLTGNIPKEIGNLKNLEYLFLGYNQLTGNIPESFRNLSSLNTLNLRNNYLTGELPAFFRNIDELSINQNLFSGPLPTELSSLEIGKSAFIENYEIPRASRVISTNGDETTTEIFIGATKNYGSWYASKFSQNDSIALLAKVIPEKGHISEKTEIYVVERSSISGKNIFYALTESGTWEVWDGSLKTLPATKAPEEMKSEEFIPIHTGKISKGKHNIYVGYALVSDNLEKPKIMTNITPFRLIISD